MTEAERAFWKLLAQLATEGKLLGDAAERIGIAFDATLPSDNPASLEQQHHQGAAPE